MGLIHYSLQPNIIGKPAADDRQVNTTWYQQGFKSCYTTVEAFADAVATEGQLWSGSIFKGGERIGANFSLSDLYALDIDNKDTAGQPLPPGELTTPQALLEQHPLRDGICLIYSSASSTDNHPRFRVVFRLPRAVRDRREYRLFTHKFWAVSAQHFTGLDPIKDEARLWYGGQQGAYYLNSDDEVVVDLDLLEQLFKGLPEEEQQKAELEAIRQVASRKELVERGLIREQDTFAGDLATDKQIFSLCLKHLPVWGPDGDGWYQANSWILGAAVDSFGLDDAAEVLEGAWGEWPRSRPFYQELQQWERNHGNPARFGSVVEVARKSPSWDEDAQQQLDDLQKAGKEKAQFLTKHSGALQLEAVQELFGFPVESEEQRVEAIGRITDLDKMKAVEAGITEIVGKHDRVHWNPLARALNATLGNLFDSKELQKLVTTAEGKRRAAQNAGQQSLVGSAAIRAASKKSRKQATYIAQMAIPRRGTLLVGGPPKAGKTSVLLAMLIRALVGAEPAEGLKGSSFSHLTIYSDDQSVDRTSAYLAAALDGLPDPEAAWNRLDQLTLRVHPKFQLDEEGIERIQAEATANPGGVFVIDSLTSTAGRLGVDENSSEMGTVIYNMREAIESVDPTALIVLIHHTKKGGSKAASAQDAFRGSSAITGAVDHLLLLERPSELKGGNTVDQSMTPDRVLHLSGREVPETKIVIRSVFNYTTDLVVDETTGDLVESQALDTASMEFIGTFKDYEADKADEAERMQTRRNALTDSAWAVLQAIMAKRNGVAQAHIPGNKGTVSKALKVLLEEPALIEELDSQDGQMKVYRAHPDCRKRLDLPSDL